uniref:Uncharacterized protein n=1 Tax=Romanomermis culicivorax TaxID=13658 RepID=A0A915HRM1_ROMCU
MNDGGEEYFLCHFLTQIAAQRELHCFEEDIPMYLGAYSPSYFRDTHTYAYDKFYRWKDHDAPREGRNSRCCRMYHPGLLDRPQVWPLSTSYIKGSRSYMGRYVADRVRFDDHLLNYVHESYNRKPDSRYLRYMTGQPGTFVGMPLALPRYQPSWHRYKIFKMTEKVII